MHWRLLYAYRRVRAHSLTLSWRLLAVCRPLTRVLQAANPAAAQLAMMMYCDEVRKLLLRFTGYECSVRSIPLSSKQNPAVRGQPAACLAVQV